MKGRTIIVCSFVLCMATHTMGQGFGEAFVLTTDPAYQGWPAVAYDGNNDCYLAVWEDYRSGKSDIYGQLVDGDGTLIGENIPICVDPADQWWPQLDFDYYQDRYLVVWEDYRTDTGGDQSIGEIRGVFINSDGSLIAKPSDDGSFVIGAPVAKVYAPAVAYSPESMSFLTVWSDDRNDPGNWAGVDVYGQRVGWDGTLYPSDPSVNIPIAEDPTIHEAVPDVAYNGVTTEWFVVYGTSTGLVKGQRVNSVGQLINMDGTVVTKPALSWGFILSWIFNNLPDGLQASVWGRYELPAGKPSAGSTEVEAVWKGMYAGRTDNDVYGQRVGFFSEGGGFVAKYVDVNGDVTQDVSNQEISIMPGAASPPDVSYSSQDSEFFVAWGNPGEAGFGFHDLYGQRLWLDADDDMNWLADDRVNTVANTQNVKYVGTDRGEGGVVGVAHGSHRNEFFVVFEDYTYGAAKGAGGVGEVGGIFVWGTPSTGVEDPGTIPASFEVLPNYPNPFNPETTIRFHLPERCGVRVSVYDLMGRRIRTLVEGIKPAERYTVVWDGTDDRGDAVVSGVYLYEVRSDLGAVTGKMSLIR